MQAARRPVTDCATGDALLSERGDALDHVLADHELVDVARRLRDGVDGVGDPLGLGDDLQRGAHRGGGTAQDLRCERSCTIERGAVIRGEAVHDLVRAARAEWADRALSI